MHLHRKAIAKYFVLQSLHKALPSTTLYYNPCTEYFPVLFVVLAQSTSQYYFVLQSLHTALPSTTLYCKACAKHVPVRLCTRRLAQSTSQYYFVLQSLHKVLPSTTLYYKACTKHFPVLLCTAKLAQTPTLPIPSCTSCFPVLSTSSFLPISRLFLLLFIPSPDAILSPSPPSPPLKS